MLVMSTELTNPTIDGLRDILKQATKIEEAQNAALYNIGRLTTALQQRVSGKLGPRHNYVNHDDVIYCCNRLVKNFEIIDSNEIKSKTNDAKNVLEEIREYFLRDEKSTEVLTS